MKSFLNKVFKLDERGTTVKTEIMAGVTTFLTMAYILAVNPGILSDAGMDPTAVLLATCIASFIGTVLMSFMANLPFVLSAGMGLNAYFAYTVCGSLGYPWQVALLAVFVEGIIFIIISVTNIREAIFNAIPMQLKAAVSVGIGIYIAFIGLQSAGLSVNDDATLVTIVNFTENLTTSGISALLAVIGVFITVILYIKNVKGSILIGIIATWLLGIICQLTGLYAPGDYFVNSEGVYELITEELRQNTAFMESIDPIYYASLIPSFEFTDFSALGKTLGQCFTVNIFDKETGVGIFNFITVVFAFMFVDLFDTLGTLIGVSAKANMLDKDGRLPAVKPALLADAIATLAGAVFGTSTTTTFVESSAGVSVGGRTGLTSLTAAILFLVSMFFAPVFIAIPAFATAPALIVVGFLMFTGITDLKLAKENYKTAIPAYLTIIAMPIFYSIAEGISIGVISYVAIDLAARLIDLCKRKPNDKAAAAVVGTEAAVTEPSLDAASDEAADADKAPEAREAEAPVNVSADGIYDAVTAPESEAAELPKEAPKKAEKLSPIMYVLAVLFILKYIFL